MGPGCRCADPVNTAYGSRRVSGTNSVDTVDLPTRDTVYGVLEMEGVQPVPILPICQPYTVPMGFRGEGTLNCRQVGRISTICMPSLS